MDRLTELDHLYQTAPVGLALVDRDLRFLRINDRLSAITGRPPEEHVGRHLREIAPEIAVHVEAVFRKVIETGEPVLNVELGAPTPAWPDVPRWWMASYHPVSSAAGRVLGVSVVVEDIADRKRTEQALRRSEARYRCVVDTQTELICRFLPDCRLTFVNEAYCRYFAKTRDQLLGVDFLALIPEEERDGVRRHVASLTQTTQTVTYSHPVIASDGGIRWQEWTDRAICNVDGRVVEFQSVGRDITAQKRAEQALEERARFEAFLADLSAAFIGVSAGHVDETIGRSLRSLTEFLDIDRSSLAEFSEDSLRVTHSYALPGIPKMPIIRLDASLAWYTATLRQGLPVALQRLPDDLPHDVADGAGKLFQGLKSHLAVPLTMDGVTIGKLSFSMFRAERSWPDMLVQRLRVVGEVFANALARKRSQEALQRAEELNRAALKSLKALSGRLLRAQEEERRRIARELHDDFNQRLVLLAMELEQLGRALPNSQVRLTGKIEALRQRTVDLSSDLHKLSHSLHSTLLEHLGVVAAARSYCDRISKQQSVRIDFGDVDMPDSLSNDVALCLFRILQEALQNATSHGSARNIQVRLAGTPTAVQLHILDDGKGFDLAEARRKQGLGLVSMQERAHSVGGTFSIRARLGEGVGIDVRIPFDAALPIDVDATALKYLTQLSHGPRWPRS